MSEATKATIQSVIRAILNAVAGVWVAKNPTIAGAVEGAAIALIALIWTYIDNKKKNPPEPPLKITTTLSAIALLVFLPGCASNFGNASKKWEYHPAEAVLQSVKVYENGKLVKEEAYAVFAPTNAQLKWRSSNRALALADSKNDVNKARSSTSDKTVSAGFDSTKQETSGEVVPGTIKAIGEAAPGIIKSAAGIP